jgi:hypothetical protein
MSMFAPMPVAQISPRLAIPALLDQAKEPKPAMAVPPQSNSARPTARYAISRLPPKRRRANCMKML